MRFAPEYVRCVFNEHFEDLFFFVERLIVQGCGEDAEGRSTPLPPRNHVT